MDYCKFIIRMSFLFIVLAGIVLFLYSPHFTRAITYEKSINVLVWPTELDPEFIADFEKQTGIKVYFSYVETNEEVIAKLRLSQSDSYDLVMVSDYMIEQMVCNKLVQPLSKTEFHHWDSLYPQLCNCYFDRDNRFSIPFFWDVYGLCLDTRYIAPGDAQEIGWGLIFDQSKIVGSIGMIEDYREAVILAGVYLWQNTNVLESLQDLSVIRDLLRNQKKWVTRYTDARAGSLIASQVAQCAVTISTDVVRLQPYHKHIGFVVPHHGKFMIIDSFAIPAATCKQEYVYQFLNYIYNPQVLQLYANKHTLRTAHRDVQSAMITDRLVPDQALMSQMTFFRTCIPEDQLAQLWISVLS